MLVKSYRKWEVLGDLARKPFSLLCFTSSPKIFLKLILSGNTTQFFFDAVLNKNRFFLSPFSAETVDINTLFGDIFPVKLKCRFLGRFMKSLLVI